MVDVIIIILIVGIVVGILYYLYKAKKRGDKCIGCPYAKQCGGNCNSSANKK